MASISRTALRPFLWADTPAEIRNLIQEALIQQKHPGWASAAAVPKEWQAVIEKENFRHLSLGKQCLLDFEAMFMLPTTAPERKKIIVDHVEHIYLDIELKNYDCATCERAYDPRSEDSAHITIIWSIRSLLNTLSTWGSRKKGKGLTLEISVHSPSDSQHWFKNFHFKSTRNKNKGDDILAPARWHDRSHGWDNGNQITLPLWEAVLRLCEKARDAGLLFYYGPVKVVTALNLRRHIRG